MYDIINALWSIIAEWCAYSGIIIATLDDAVCQQNINLPIDMLTRCNMKVKYIYFLNNNCVIQAGVDCSVSITT